jgi:hypothetical protein
MQTIMAHLPEFYYITELEAPVLSNGNAALNSEVPMTTMMTGS